MDPMGKMSFTIERQPSATWTEQLNSSFLRVQTFNGSPLYERGSSSSLLSKLSIWALRKMPLASSLTRQGMRKWVSVRDPILEEDVSDSGRGILRQCLCRTRGTFHEKRCIRFGKSLANSIKQEGKKPKLINLLRKKISSRGVFVISIFTELKLSLLCLSSEYPATWRTNHVLLSTDASQTEGKTFLLLIEYPCRYLQKRVSKFCQNLHAESSSSKAIRTENRRWTTAQFIKIMVWSYLMHSPKKKQKR